MTGQPRESPFAWVTWISKLLAGENPCDFSVWFQAHYRGYDTVPDSGQMALWTIEHASQVKKRAEALRTAGFTVTIEDQNKGVYRSRAGLTIGFKPDIVAKCGCEMHAKGDKIVDIKTGQPRISDTVQMLLYVLMTGLEAGELYYSKTGETLCVGKEAADKSFQRNLNDAVERIVAIEPALKVPGKNCRFCKITKADCPERFEAA